MASPPAAGLARRQAVWKASAISLRRSGTISKSGILNSAGGHLAAWAAAQPGAQVKPALVYSLAGVLDLVEGANRGVYERAIEGLMDGLPADRPAEYAAASPAELLPISVPQLLVHGLLDLADNVEMNRTYAERARAAGDTVELVELRAADHFDVIEPGTEAWAQIVALLSERVPSDLTRIES